MRFYLMPQDVSAMVWEYQSKNWWP